MFNTKKVIQMKNIILFLFPLFLLSCTTTSNETEESSKRKAEWVSLFNGKDLDGWQIKIADQEIGVNLHNTFSVEDGILKIGYDGYGSFDEQFGALYTDKPYTNYRLKVEYRFVGETAPGAPSWGIRDSGVQYYGQDPKTMAIDQHFPVCLEYNLHGGNGTDERPVGEICLSGTLVDLNGVEVKGCNAATTPITIHGDQWATLEIDVKGNEIKHFINGTEIVAFENPRFDREHELGKTFIKDGNEALRSGFISLQSNSHSIQFRKIEILEY
jgi:hypothetical protein